MYQFGTLLLQKQWWINKKETPIHTPTCVTGDSKKEAEPPLLEEDDHAVMPVLLRVGSPIFSMQSNVVVIIAFPGFILLLLRLWLQL